MRLPGLLLVLGLVSAACGPSAQVVAGFVVDVDSSSITQVDSFTLRTPDGAELVFSVGRLQLDEGAFPAGHLREHMALGQAIAVTYRDEDGKRIAYRLTDAT